jgi:hypothetical protein
MAHICMASDCTADATLQWQRYHDNGEDAEIVRGCDTHKVGDELAAGIHAATCPAPPECTCSEAHPVYPTPGP